ncbi:DUF134 domain-containing protein [Trichlorobacter sp.]|jgi:uncharacterized protein|uniref:DUF134 domain-containing protein n=1 Tax=Trichlorobacter sp. TaxID=2911007 RepID=UPI002A36CBCA|nr:DUF134 domain-containing protein [Trichlorobacter sp.]MDY0384116.1 DUF134 domain-containing protein [Trichlorobacter sp.]
MPRPRKPRTCACPQRAAFEAVYKPAGIPLKELQKVSLFHDELEALYLCDAEGKTQEQAGCCMGVSRGTVQRLVSEARRKVASAMVRQQALVIAPKTSDDVPDKGEDQ